ncbi:MAG TPA: hypothetical protein VKA84_00805 [Gemmatimonadaceae bacterium]|nr:hypothetical protein [Gemmatimonadaceae bacterium]
MTEYKMRDYVPGEEAARERNGLAYQLATQVVPVFAILAALALALLTVYVPPRYTIDVQLVNCGPIPAVIEAGPYGSWSTIVLRIDGGRNYFVNGERVAGDQLGERLEAIYSQRPDKILFVRAGGEAGSYQEFYTALDVALGAGVRVLALAPDMSTPECMNRFGIP